MLKYLSPVNLTHQHISKKKNEFNFKLIAGLLIVSSDRYSPMPVKRLVCEFTWWIVNDRQRGSDLSRTLSYGAIRVLSTLRALPSPTVTLFIKRSLLFYHTMGNYITRSKHNSRWLQLRTRQNEWINANLVFFSLCRCSIVLLYSIVLMRTKYVILIQRQRGHIFPRANIDLGSIAGEHSSQLHSVQ